jgi:regulator of RNase E activity RraA
MELSPGAWGKLHEVSTASLTSELLKLGFRNTFMTGIRPLRPDRRMVGYAFTLRYIPAREDLDFQVEYDNWTNPQRVAVETIGPDQVLVIDTRGQLGAASLGHILATRLMVRGAAGLVTDGALRDSPAIATLDFPSYAAGAHGTTSSVLHHPADFGLPIGCGGVLVEPGDVLVGDAEGVVVIPAQVAEDVAARCWERDQLETWLQRRVADGVSIRGTYPPDEATRAEWDAVRGDDAAGGS